MAASGHAIQLGFVCLCISVIFVNGGARVSTFKTPTCSLQTSQGSFLPCTISLRACKAPQGRRHAPSSSSSSSSSSPSSSSVHMEGKKEEGEEEEEEKIIVEEKVVNSEGKTSIVDVNFSLLQNRRAVVVVQRRGAHHHHHHHHQEVKGRCMLAYVELKEPGHVTLADLVLPHGSYQVKVYRNGGGGGEGEVRRLSHDFSLPSPVRSSQRSRSLNRLRRHKAPRDQRRRISTEELILPHFGLEVEEVEEVEEEEGEKRRSNTSHITHGGGGGGGGYFCQCCKCFNFKLDYDDLKAVLTFDYNVNSSCASACSDVNVQLYRDKSETEDQCVSERSILPVQDVERIGIDRNVTEGPVRYSDIRKGCYFVELKPQMYRMPERTVFLWADPSIQVTNMNNWTTVFLLDLNPQRRSMTVRWSVVRPYNFSAYELSLHHHPALPIRCTGQQIFPNMSIIPPHGRLLLSKPEHLFFNLSIGWYCARVTPRDKRCPLDGCQVVSSPPVHLSEPEQLTCPEGVSEAGECIEGSALGLSLLVVGCVVGALVTGVTVAWGLLHLWPSLTQVFSSTQYSPVPLRTGAKASRGQKQVVLLVWTPQGPYGVQVMPIIAAFKTVLRTYANCEVYDYLELSSLPEKHQLRLLSAPTTWLDSILASPSIKVIIVATEGAWERQAEWRQVTPGKNGDLTSPPTPGHAHDQVLFPYLLRRLHEQTDLAGDYSRLFHVRFSEVSPPSVELTHVVSLKRYKIPEHLRSLATSLHGNVASVSFEDPKEDQLVDLRRALSLHPNYRSNQTDPRVDPPWPTLVENGHSTIPDVAMSCVRASEGLNSVDSSPVANGVVRESR